MEGEYLWQWNINKVQTILQKLTTLKYFNSRPRTELVLVQEDQGGRESRPILDTMASEAELGDEIGEKK